MDIAEGVHKSKGAMKSVKIALAFSAVLVVSYYFFNSGFPAITGYKASTNGFNSTTGFHYEELATVLERAANPNKTVIITYLNDAWAEPNSVFDLQLESFRIGNNTAALIKHLVAVSLDEKAHARCLSLKLNCYFLRLEGYNFSNAAFFMTPMYVEMMWRRLDFMHTVLSLGYNFLFTDADIMWFRDPFPHLDDDAHFHIACDHYNGNPTDAHNSVNAGFMYVKSNMHTVLFYKLWYYSRRLYPGKNEQEVYNLIKHGPLFKIIGMKVRYLDTMYFGGFCEASKDFSQVCTMHANCCYGLKHKVNDLKLIIGDWRKYSTEEKPPRPFKWSAPKMC
ncbi:hypothetical protein V2J09_011284 [Rumex salicifolius]